MRYLPALSAAFFGGIILLGAAQWVSSPQAQAAMSLMGGALLVVVAIRGLAGLAGLGQDQKATLGATETQLVESQNVTVETRTLGIRARRGPYRARLTNERVLLSLRVMSIPTKFDVTIAWLAPGKPQSLRSIEIADDEIRLIPERRFASGWRIFAPNAADWRAALTEHHPELVRTLLR